MKPKLVIILTLLVLGFAAAELTHALTVQEILQGYDNPQGQVLGASTYSYYRTITVLHSQVPNTDQSNFPVLVSGTYPYLATTGNGGKVQNASGYDIGFYSDSACTVKLPWETEKYVPATGEVDYWISLPTLSHNSDTVFYLCYGNSSISSDQSNKTAVWTGGSYLGVWHLADGTNLNTNDSTSNGLNAANHGLTAATGQIDGGGHISADNTGLSFTTQNLTTGTLSIWMTGSSGEIWAGDASGDYGLFINGSSLYYKNFSGNFAIVTYGGTFNPGTFYKIDVVRNATSVSFYVNGSQVGATQTLADNSTTGISGINGGYGLVTTIDEARISSNVLAADWIKTEYNNQSSPSSFYTLGSETAGTGVGNPTPTPTVTPGGDTTPPVISSISSSAISSTAASLSWTTDEQSDSQVDYGTTTGYGTSSSLNSSLTTSHSVSISSLAASTLYHYRVKSRDASGNLAVSSDNTFTTSAASSDTTPPSTPTNLSATAVSSSQISLSWTVSTDNIAVTGYKIFRAGVQVGTAVTNSYSDSALTASTSYSYTVSAYDAAGNNSSQSSSSSATTQAAGSPGGTTVVLNGQTYTLKANPRVWFDGPGGPLTTAMQDTSNRAQMANPMYAGLVSLVNTEKSRNICSTGPNTYSGAICPGSMFYLSNNLFYGADAIFLWYAQGANPADPNGYLAFGKQMVTNFEDIATGSFACNEAVSNCDRYNYDIFDPAAEDYVWAAYSLLRSTNQLSPAEIATFAGKVLNDNTTAHNGFAPTPCTPITISNGSGTVTSSAGSNVVTGVGTSFTTQLSPGQILFAGASGSNDQTIGYIYSITDNTHLVLTTYGTGGAASYSGVNFRFANSWTTGNCGLMWFMKHQHSPPPLNASEAANFPTDYPTNGGDFYAYNNNFGDCAQYNICEMILHSYIMAGLALADDSGIARTMLTEAYQFWHDYSLPFYESAITPFNPGGGSYSVYRWQTDLIESVLALKQSVVNSPVPAFASLKNMLPYVYMGVVPNTYDQLAGWGDGGGGVQGEGFINYAALPASFLFDGSPETQAYYNYLRNVRQDYPNQCSYAGGIYCSFFYTFYNYNESSIAPPTTQYIFKDPDITNAQCLAIYVNNCLNQVYMDAISKSGNSPTDDMLMIEAGFNEFQLDHWQGPTQGAFHIYRGSSANGSGVYLLGGDNTPNGGDGSFYNGAFQENMIDLNGTTTTYPDNPDYSTAPFLRWAGADPTGDPSSRYMYTMIDLTPTYQASGNATRVQRHIAQFKKSGAQDYIVTYDDIALSSPIATAPKAYFHYVLNGQSPAAAISYSGAARTVSNTQSASKLNSSFLPVAGPSTAALVVDNANGSYTGGNGYTFRAYMCPSSNGTTCDASKTSGEWFGVFEAINGTTGSMPPLTQPSCSGTGGNCAVVQIADATSPKVAVFARQGALLTAASFTTTHTGTAQYLIAGLSPGTYDVSKGGVKFISAQSVNSGDNTLYFESTAGAIQLTQVGTSPAPTPTPTGTPTPTPSPTPTPPPAISNLLGSNTTASTTTVSWSTDQVTNGQVFYGLTSAYGSQSAIVDANPLATSHSITISSLSSNTTYHFKVQSTNSNGQSSQTGDFTFTTLSPPSAPAPIITSFTGNPTTITVGGNTTLSFSVSNSPTSLTINQAVGSVLGSSSKLVSPVVTTTYTLTASNSAGTATAQVTITVNPLSPTPTPTPSPTPTGSPTPTPTPAPGSAPSITAFAANPSSVVSGAAVSLSFTVSSTSLTLLSIDNAVGSVLGTSSKVVNPTVTTTYTLTATNLAGSATAQVTVNVTPVSSGGGLSGGGSSGGGSTGGPPGSSGTPSTDTPGVIVYIPAAPITPSTSGSSLRLINLNGTYYLVINNTLHGITNPGMLNSYGFSLNQATKATTQDQALPQGTLLTPGDGSLVKSKADPTVYLISNQTRYAFTSAKVFSSLGFRFSSVLLVTDPELQALPKALDVSNPIASHLPGLDINKNGTIYWIGLDSQLHPYTSLAIFNSWRIPNDFTNVVPANAADLALPVGSAVVERVVN